MKTKLTLIIMLLVTTAAYASLGPVNFAQLKPHYLSIPHGKIEYYRFGEGSPIVLISGFASNLAGWNQQFVASLANEHEVIIFDNRNIDGSAQDTTTYSAKALAADTHALVTKLHLQKPTILGISMGGMIAQQYALLYPTDISNLILVNTVIAGNQSIAPTPFATDAILHTPENSMKRYVTGIRLLAPPKWWARITYSMARNHFPGDKTSFSIAEDILNEQRQLILGWSKDNATGAEIKTIQTPTLILNGGEDAVIPPTNSEILAHTIPHATLIRWQDGGHAMLYQYPLQIAQTINEFLI